VIGYQTGLGPALPITPSGRSVSPRSAGAVEEEPTDRQRQVFTAVMIDGIPLDAGGAARIEP